MNESGPWIDNENAEKRALALKIRKERQKERKALDVSWT
jgi:hypothetical protein